MDNKPENAKNFRETALSHIPQDIVESMQASMSVKTEGMSILEAITANDVGKMLPKSIAEPVVSPTSTVVVVNGQAIKVATDPTNGAVTMLLYILATELSKNKKIAKILKQFNFVFYDVNNVQIYPPLKNAKK